VTFTVTRVSLYQARRPCVMAAMRSMGTCGGLRYSRPEQHGTCPLLRLFVQVTKLVGVKLHAHVTGRSKFDHCRSRGNSARVLTTSQVGRQGFDSRQEQGRDFFLSVTASRLALGPTRPPVQWVPGVKRPRREVNHSLSSSSEIKDTWSYTSTSPYVFMV